MKTVILRSIMALFVLATALRLSRFFPDGKMVPVWLTMIGLLLAAAWSYFAATTYRRQLPSRPLLIGFGILTFFWVWAMGGNYFMLFGLFPSYETSDVTHDRVVVIEKALGAPFPAGTQLLMYRKMRGPDGNMIMLKAEMPEAACVSYVRDSILANADSYTMEPSERESADDWYDPYARAAIQGVSSTRYKIELSSDTRADANPAIEITTLQVSPETTAFYCSYYTAESSDVRSTSIWQRR